MRYCVLILLFFISLPALAQNAAVGQAAFQARGTLIRDIVMEGFALQDKHQFIKLFKPYRNKYLTTLDMDGILQKIQDIYEKEGYKQLVSITYRVVKHRLVFTALMIS
jgi:hemolysin activation/secretion protein